MFLQWYDILEIDDIGQPFFKDSSIKELLLTADHGRYISWVIMKLVVDGTSQMFHIHCLDNHFAVFVRGGIFAMSFYLIARCSVLNTKSKYLNPLTYLFVFVMGMMCYSGLSLSDYNQNFAYIMNFCLFFPLFFIICRYFLDGQMPSKNDLFKNSFWAFVLGISAHFNFIVMTGVLSFLLLYLFFKSEKSKFFKNLFKMSTLSPLFFFLTGMVISIFSPHFQSLLNKQRRPDVSRLDFVLGNFNDYFLELLKELYHSHQMELQMIFLLTVFSIYYAISQKKNIQKNLVLVCSLIWGIFIFNLSLIVCGKSMNGRYWFYHLDLKYITSLFLLVAIVLLFSVLIKELPKWGGWGIFLLLFSILCFHFDYKKYQKYEVQKDEKVRVYEMEKAIIFYSKCGYEDIYYPSNRTLPKHRNSTQNWYFHSFRKFIKKNYDIDLPNKPLRELPQKDFEERAQKDGLVFTQEELNNLDFTELINYSKLNSEEIQCYPIK